MRRFGTPVISESIPDEFCNYVPAPADRVNTLPLGTLVYVQNYRKYRPYRVVRWGKHHLKRLKWQQHLDGHLVGSDEYLPIRDRNLKFRIDVKGRRKHG